jgi:ubiquinol-cytochrome c reductase cytochrome c1 subunit
MDDATASMSFGVVAPDLSSAGLIYEEHFLAALIKDPVKALKVGHKFDETNPHPMPAFYGLGGDLDQEIADMVAYLQSVAPQDITNEALFEDACVRCHSMKYDKKAMSSERGAMEAYMGMLPPDVSMSIRAKREKYLTTFINDPQKHLEGTAMPRVGLTETAQTQVVEYMENVGDSKKEERERVGLYIMGFFVILSVFAVLWKNKVWREVE